MNNFDMFKKMNVHELADWIDKYVVFDNSPHIVWWDEHYCKNCESIMCRYEGSEREFTCAWCEINDNKCRFFPEMDEAPDSNEIVKMWLESEAE